VTDLLDSHDRRAVADRGAVIYDAPDLLGDADADALRLRRGTAPSKEERPLGIGEHLRGVPDRFKKPDRRPRFPIPRYGGTKAAS